jgi:DNA-directed RNA polymerase specialized sigma24 family protein
MYATTIDPSVSTTVSTPDPSTPDPAIVRTNLDAVYRARWSALLEVARKYVRKDYDASDAVQDAFVLVLARPPRDTSPRGLGIALDAAVRTACERQRRVRRDDQELKIGLRKRFPV